MTSLRFMKERKGDGIGLNSMVLLSFLLHALVLSIIILSPTWPTPKWTFGPVYTVDLVSHPVNLVENKAQRSPSKEIVGIGSRERSVVLKSKSKDVPPVPVSKRETPKKAVTDDVNRAIEDIRKKTTSSEETSRQVSSRGSEEMTMKMKVYYSIIWSRIRDQWALPEGILAQDNIEAVIAVTILRNGTVVDLNFEKSSGNKYFDESAVKAIKKASPFPALPEWMRGSSLEVGIRFHSSELK
jgi:colicin import membrane protein